MYALLLSALPASKSDVVDTFLLLSISCMADKCLQLWNEIDTKLCDSWFF